MVSFRALLSVVSAALTAAAPTPLSDVWEYTAPLPFARSDHTATVVGSLIYLAGGCNGAQNCAGGRCACTSVTSNLIAYAPTTNSYNTSLAPMPTARYRHLACESGGTIYIFGGRALVTDALLTTVDAYNTATGRWRTLASAYPADLGSDNSCSTVGDSIYVFGGYTVDYAATLNSTYAFAPKTGAWTRLANMTRSRGDFSSVATVDGSVSVYGGYKVSSPPDFDVDFCNPLSHHEVYDPRKNSWAVSAPLPRALAEKDDGVLLNNRIFSIGGETKAVKFACTDTDITPLKTVYSFDAAAGGWATETELPDVRMRFASASYANKLYVFGGQGALVDGLFLPVLSTTMSYAPAIEAPPGASLSYTPAQMAAGILGTVGGIVVLGLVGYYFCACCRSRFAKSPTALP